MWVFQAIWNQTIWRNKLGELKVWMSTKDTDSEISSTILEGLRFWLNPCHEPAELPVDTQPLYHAHEDIGWGNFLEGFPHIDWQSRQEKYYSDIGSQRSGALWNAGLIQELWKIVKALWDDRNEVMHQTTNITKEADKKECDRTIKQLYKRLENKAGTNDRHMFSCTLNELLIKPLPYKKGMDDPGTNYLVALEG
jgi:hypothetical protein